MRARIHVVTLGVGDLRRAFDFYRDGMGLSSPGIVGTQFPGDETNAAGSAAMFTLDDGLVLSLYPRAELAKDAGLPPGEVGGPTMSLGHVVDSRDEVDHLLDEVRRAGGTVVGSPRERPWGIYSGYFRDPDGHLWEVMRVLDTP
jgi:catechol 2,3-dioxygenase-like lactoylglutathione lyase family enzyme